MRFMASRFRWLRLATKHNSAPAGGPTGSGLKLASTNGFDWCGGMVSSDGVDVKVPRNESMMLISEVPMDVWHDNRAGGRSSRSIPGHQLHRLRLRWVRFAIEPRFGMTKGCCAKPKCPSSFPRKSGVHSTKSVDSTTRRKVRFHEPSTKLFNSCCGNGWLLLAGLWFASHGLSD